MRFLHVLEVTALGIWTGALLGFGLIAQVLFDVIPSRQAAGEAAGAAIARLESLGLLLGAIALWAISSRRRWDTSRARRLRWLAVLAMVVVTALSATWVRGRLDAIQAQMDRPIEQYERTHPLRRSYGQWHGISLAMGALVTALGAAALASAAAAGPPRAE